jgi:hypothetical protein
MNLMPEKFANALVSPVYPARRASGPVVGFMPGFLKSWKQCELTLVTKVVI